MFDDGARILRALGVPEHLQVVEANLNLRAGMWPELTLTLLPDPDNVSEFATYTLTPTEGPVRASRGPKGPNPTSAPAFDVDGAVEAAKARLNHSLTRACALHSNQIRHGFQTEARHRLEESVRWQRDVRMRFVEFSTHTLRLPAQWLMEDWCDLRAVLEEGGA